MKEKVKLGQNRSRFFTCVLHFYSICQFQVFVYSAVLFFILKVTNLRLDGVQLDLFSSQPFERLSPNAKIVIENTVINSVGK